MAPTATPTVTPTGTPTDDPPTGEPTKEPTKEPTGQPTKEPTNEPTVQPTKQPTEQPVVVAVNGVSFPQTVFETLVVEAAPTRRRLLQALTPAGQAYVDNFATAYCNNLNLVYNTDCFATTTVDFAANKLNIKIFVDPLIAATATEAEKDAAAASGQTAADAASPAAQSTGVVSATASMTVNPTASPTPEPTLSWQSRFLFWMWLVNWFKSMW
jgi:hypothetical protein